MHLSDRVILIRYDAFIEDNPEGTLNKVNIAIPMIRGIFSSLIKEEKRWLMTLVQYKIFSWIFSWNIFSLTREEKVTNDSGAGQNDGDVLICSLPKKGVIGNAGCCWQLLAVVNDTTIWTNFLDYHCHLSGYIVCRTNLYKIWYGPERHNRFPSEKPLW